MKFEVTKEYGNTYEVKLGQETKDRLVNVWTGFCVLAIGAGVLYLKNQKTDQTDE